MELPVLSSIIGVCVIYRLLLNKKGISWFIFLISIAVLYYFQPTSTIRYFDFWVPSVTILISVIVWEIITPNERKRSKETKITYLLLVGFFLALLSIRLLPQSWYSKFISIPAFFQILVFLTLSVFLVFITRKARDGKRIATIEIFLLLVIFLVIKNTDLSLLLSKTLRTLNDQSINLAGSSEIVWIGYSYFAFRIIHVLLEFKKQKAPEMQLHTFVGYLLFFPALLAGPIMYADKYKKELEKEIDFNKNTIIYAFKRIGLGLFQKYIIADLLALIALNNTLSNQVRDAKWMWLFVIAYSLRIYFDFSGYTHIAIGIANLIGIQLPENFDKPLLSPTITIFWNKWHMTLTQWFRAYYFNPVSRYLKRNLKKVNPNVILAFMQITTMVLIGLWHGVNNNFVIWGVWIGAGLFIQNQITGYYAKKLGQGKPFWQLNMPARILSNAITFLYITTGWVWFALPSVESSMKVFTTLLGLK